MTLTEIKREAAELSEDERLDLQAFLLHVGRVNDLENKRELGDRMRRMDAGEKFCLDDFILANLPPEMRSKE